MSLQPPPALHLFHMNTSHTSITRFNLCYISFVTICASSNIHFPASEGSWITDSGNERVVASPGGCRHFELDVAHWRTHRVTVREISPMPLHQPSTHFSSGPFDAGDDTSPHPRTSCLTITGKLSTRLHSQSIVYGKGSLLAMRQPRNRHGSNA